MIFILRDSDYGRPGGGDHRNHYRRTQNLYPLRRVRSRGEAPDAAGTGRPVQRQPLCYQRGGRGPGDQWLHQDRPHEVDRSGGLEERGKPVHPVGPRPVRHAEHETAAGPAGSPEVPRTRMRPQSGGERDEGTARPAPRPPHRRGDGRRPEEARPV